MQILTATAALALPAGRPAWGIDDDGRMLLRTIQHVDVLTVLLRDGRIDADTTRSENITDWPHAYQWMSEQVAAHCSTNDEFNPAAGAVFWAWARTTRHRLTTMTAAHTRAVNDADSYVLLNLRVPAKRVLLTDYDDWHWVMSDEFVLTAAEERELDAAYERDDWSWETPAATAIRRRLELGELSSVDAESLLTEARRSSWALSLVDAHRRPAPRAEWQACVSHLERDDVVEAVILTRD